MRKPLNRRVAERRILSAAAAAIVLTVASLSGPALPVPASAAPTDRTPSSGMLRPGDTMGPDVVTGRAAPPPPARMRDSYDDTMRLAASCATGALASAAARSTPITAEVAAELGDKGLTGGRGAVCLKANDTADQQGRAERDAALAALKGSAPGTMDAARTVARAAKPGSTLEIIPIPQWCIDHALDGWWGYRTSQCRIRDITVLFWVITNGSYRHVGTAKALEYDYAFTSDLIDRYAFQLRIAKYWGERAGNIEFLTRVVGGSFCSGDCKPDGGTGINPGRFARNVNNDGESFWISTRSEPGGIGYSEPSWEWHIESPFFLPSTTTRPTAPQIRCDNAFSTDGNDSGDPGPNLRQDPTIGAGCIFGSHFPVMRYSKTGFYPTLAMHIEAAQNSGLPGKHPGGVALKRLQDPVKKRQNGDKACPPSPVWLRPAGKSCDEYPFRSTYQGASTADPQGTARTFAPPNSQWCEMDPAWGVPTGVTGPTGWSSCMIPAADNSRGGAALGGFYRSNRILDGDLFRVEITP